MSTFAIVVILLAVASGVAFLLMKKGKIKKQKENYLVDAMSVTEAEAKLVKKFTDEAVKLEYEVVKVSETNIIEVI